MNDKIFTLIKNLNNKYAISGLYTLSIGALAVYASNDLNNVNNNYLKNILHTKANYSNFENISENETTNSYHIWNKYKIVDGKIVNNEEYEKNLLIDKTIDSFNSVIVYPYENFFPSDERLLKDNKIKKHNIVITNHSNTNEIISKIIDNSNKIENNTSVFKTSYSTIYIKQLRNIIDGIIKYGTNDINEDLYLLENLKICYVDNSNISYKLLTKCYYDNNTNTIFLNEDYVNSEDEIKNILNHLIIHIRQTSINNDNLLSYNNTKNILFEGPAYSYRNYLFKQNNINVFKSNDINSGYIYEDKEKEIAVLAIFNKDKTTKDYYNYLFDEDSEKYLELLNITSSDEYLEFLKALESINSYNGKLALKYYSNINNYNVTLKDINNFNKNFGKYHKLYLYQKYVRNLLEYQKKYHDLSLEENLFLYQVGTNIINNYAALGLTNEEVKIYNEMSKLNEKYLNFLKEYYNVDEIDKYSTRNLSNQFNYYYNIVNFESEINTNDAQNLLQKLPMLDLVLNTQSVINTNELTLYKK